MKIDKIISLLLTTCLVLLATACDRGVDGEEDSKPALLSSHSDEQKVLVTMLQFNEVESGTDAYLTRMLVSERYIRIDDGEAIDGYVLFDRLKKRIFSVVDENESILIVDPVFPLQDIPVDLQIRSEQIDMDDAPTVAGVKPAYYRFYANDDLCYSVISADGFLPEVTNALQIYQQVLAAQQQESLEATPKELQTPCFLANYIYAANVYLSKGFPIEQWDDAGYHRSLSGIEENVSVSKSLFSLPDGYEYFSIGSGNIKL